MAIELKRIKELISAMNRAGLSKLRLKEGDSELELEKKRSDPKGPGPVAVMMSPPAEGQPMPAATKPEPSEEVSGNHITSPMVGTFYASLSPESSHFVQVGTTVAEDTIVCIVEAMKVMNEVKAGMKGTIKEILAENGHPVEFGTKLFLVS